jgi:hypothetical protein
VTYQESGFDRNSSTIDLISCNHQVLEKWEYIDRLHQLLVDFKKAYVDRRKMLPMKIFRSIFFIYNLNQQSEFTFYKLML